MHSLLLFRLTGSTLNPLARAYNHARGVFQDMDAPVNFAFRL